MKISEALQRIDELCPNSFSEGEKLKWLSNLDWTIKVEILDIRQSGVSFNGYDENTDLERELLAEPPYDEMYIYWMQAMVDYHNREMASYNNAIAKFEEMYMRFRNWYNREHMARQTSFRFW